MISAWSAVIILFILSVQAFAQEQMAVRINEQGIMKILELVVKYNSSSKEGKTFVIPQDIYKFTIPKKTFEKNPIIQVANQISDLNLTKDLDFYFNTSDIKVSGKVDPKSLKTEISNSHSNGFDLKLSLNIPSVILKGDRLALCETRLGQTKKCGEGLKATLNEVSISTIGVLKMNAVFRIQTDKEVVRIKLLSVESNLEKPDAPTLDINFKSIVIPKISILISGISDLK